MILLEDRQQRDLSTAFSEPFVGAPGWWGSRSRRLPFQPRNTSGWETNSLQENFVARLRRHMTRPCRSGKRLPAAILVTASRYLEGMNWRDRIELNPVVLIGKPVVRGTRLAVELILELLAAGESENDPLSDYPRLTREDLRACLRVRQSPCTREFSTPRRRPICALPITMSYGRAPIFQVPATRTFWNGPRPRAEFSSRWTAISGRSQSRDGNG